MYEWRYNSTYSNSRHWMEVNVQRRRRVTPGELSGFRTEMEAG
jgi:hypothetical protein